MFLTEHPIHAYIISMYLIKNLNSPLEEHKQRYIVGFKKNQTRLLKQNKIESETKLKFQVLPKHIWNQR